MEERKALTKRQSDIYGFIKEYIGEEGISPSVQEIARRFGFRSTNAVNDFLTALEKKGYISRKSKGISRGIVLCGEGTERKAPKEAAPSAVAIRTLLIIGDGHSSNAFSVFTNPRGSISVDPDHFSLGQNAFASIVKDDGMSDAGIYAGDLALLTQLHDNSYETGCRVLAMINDMQVLRNCERTQSGWRLSASRRGYPKHDIPADGSTGIILGKLAGIIRKVGMSQPPDRGY